MEIENLGNLTLRINGPDVREYPYVDFDLHNVPYDSSVSLHFITKINLDLSAELLEDKSPYKVIIHNTGEDITSRNVDSFEVTVPEDGYYQVITLVLPTTDYIENVLGYTPGGKVEDNLNTNIVAAEIINNSIRFKILTHTLDEDSGYYAHIWTDWQTISLNDMLELLDKEELFYDLKDITINKYQESVFVYDNLYNCYINKATDLLNLYGSDSNFCAGDSLCRDSLGEHKMEIQTRDYLWMAINVIKYCIQNCQYLKALKILNCVSTCSGICPKIQKSNTKIYKGCGCNKRN